MGEQTEAEYAIEFMDALDPESIKLGSSTLATANVAILASINISDPANAEVSISDTGHVLFGMDGWNGHRLNRLGILLLF